MSKNQQIIDSAIEQEYEYGFTTDIEQDTIPPGLNEDVIRFISAKKDEPEWLLDWRLKAFNRWLEMEEPDWSKLNYSKIDFQKICGLLTDHFQISLKSLPALILYFFLIKLEYKAKFVFFCFSLLIFQR